MKSLITFVFTLGVSILFSQKKECYDESWKEISCNKNYAYYRLFLNNKLSGGLYKVEDYYKDGTLQMEGSYSDNLYFYKQGEFKYYYENGKNSSIENYANNKLIGEFKKWYPNRQLKWEGRYLNDGNPEYINFWTEDGIQSVKDGDGKFFLKSNDGSFSEGNLKNGKEDGIWKGYMPDLNLTYEDKYDNGIFIEGTSKREGKKYIYTTIQDIPYPQKGNDDLRNFVITNFKFPEKIVKDNYSDAIILVITIDESGKIFDINTENIVDEKVKEKLINTVRKYPGKFIIPKIRGFVTKQTIKLPILIIE
ncbi:toxin-antitoxin system YwqK family antitoxin [Chryseobacterium shandongense]|uniref:TonB C-terminal domain-containing protein n=1 Tax=Chryseobacterium shandongense TaxID=1493872 RepID=A0ABM7BAW3_9FLAO|nr:hypothetical protein [Chryseobacterium shandongense]AZA95984.1 hypothetical protein EG353_10595 [Chryseobacterium shandongense]